VKGAQFPDLSENVERELALMLGSITHHIHPAIVESIKHDNIGYEERFKSICSEQLDASSFFYPESDCVFPGVRRPINKEKTPQWKNNINEADGTILNDNTFPRHVWAYLAEDKAYSGGTAGMWASSGLARFELAHVFGHKSDERALEKRVFSSLSNQVEPYGLFTSASNVVLIPKGFAKPTDHMESIKVCFYKRHIELYGNNIIGASELNETSLPGWYDDIDWLSPILPENWQQKTSNLLAYREQYLCNKYKKR